MRKNIHWIWLLFAILTLISRFVYGRKYEIKNDQFNLSNIGIVLTIIALLFFGLFVFFETIKKTKD